MKLTYYGHACFAVVVWGKNLLFDPFITPNPLAKKSTPQKSQPIQSGFAWHGDHVAGLVEIAKPALR